MKSQPREQLKLDLGLKKKKPTNRQKHWKRYNIELMCPGAAGCRDIDHCRHSSAHRWDTDCDCRCKGSGPETGVCISLTKAVLDKLRG